MDDEVQDFKDIEDLIFSEVEEEVQDQFQIDTTGLINRLIQHFERWFYGLLCTTIKTHDRIIQETENPVDCIAVYNHLLRISRKQKSNSVWANNTYLQKGLRLSEKRLKRAKAELHRIGLLEYKQETDRKTGQITKHYTVIRYIPTPTYVFKDLYQDKNTTGSISTPVDIHPCGYGGQMLKDVNKVLKEDNKRIVELFFQTYGEHIPKNILDTYIEQDITRCVHYMLKQTGIQKPIPYLARLLQNIDSVPDLEPTIGELIYHNTLERSKELEAVRKKVQKERETFKPEDTPEVQALHKRLGIKQSVTTGVT
jgi:hypothetical protein